MSTSAMRYLSCGLLRRNSRSAKISPLQVLVTMHMMYVGHAGGAAVWADDYSMSSPIPECISGGTAWVQDWRMKQKYVTSAEPGRVKKGGLLRVGAEKAASSRKWTFTINSVYSEYDNTLDV